MPPTIQNGTNPTEKRPVKAPEKRYLRFSFLKHNLNVMLHLQVRLNMQS